MAKSASPQHHLIFFITGNPGFSTYYDTFLLTLGELLSSREASSKVYHIHTQDLAGFGSYDDGNLYDLERQIQILYDALVGMSISTGPRAGQPYDSVILIGHSVGSYILLEILSRLRGFSQRPGSDEAKMKAATVQANTGILLFPTVTHIAKSPSGVKISTLFRIPYFPKIASTMAKALIWPIPRGILRRLVGIVTGMPSAAAEVTMNFLRSPTGIHQALYLAQDEMQTITEDRWDEEIWGLEHTEANTDSSVPKLIFYFGQNDHWVADHTRDALIAARGKRRGESKNSKPLMLIDEDGVDHGFCIKHSESIAEKVAVWIENIAEAS